MGAELISHFIKGEEKHVTILVATSGDTGGAVAAGFYNTPGIEVIILYPKGKVSDLQEKQLTTLGNNITALEIEGTFDDCQAIVKEAFLDPQLTEKYNLSSANSINIARLIPQSFYYFEAYKQIKKRGKKTVFSVPSGNFGNLTAGLLAKKMGLPIDHFIAATNINNIVPKYLETGIYEPKPSVATISNAMDVGSPSNFTRLLALYDNDYEALKSDVSGFYISDHDDKIVMKDIHDQHSYVADPHGAIGYAAIKEFQKKNDDHIGIYLETAHPAKFLDVVNDVLPVKAKVPARLQAVADKEKVAHLLKPEFKGVKDWLMKR
jgi:threonine synthase